MKGTLATSIQALSVALALGHIALAGPTPRKRSTTPVSASTISSFAPFTQFARATYCSPDLQWNCGASCAANPTFQPTLVGGDGSDVQVFFVGYDPTTNAAVVAHQGTDPAELEADLTDIDALKTTLNTTLFPGTDSSMEVHQGFSDEHAKTADQVLSAVQAVISSKGATAIHCIGHSLGGALAQLDSLMMTLHFPNVAVKGVTYGNPRVGDSNYAAFFDSKVSDFTRVNNQQDLVPIVPGEFLGFQHPHGEVHLLSDGTAVACSGDDDDSDSQCTDQSVPTLFEGSIPDHLGPYDGISLGSDAC